jgi:hypothetical protein
LWFFGCTLGRIALFVLTPALDLIAVELSHAVGFPMPALFLLALALTPPSVVGVAVGVGGVPALAHVVADFPQLVQHTIASLLRGTPEKNPTSGYSAARLSHELAPVEK